MVEKEFVSMDSATQGRAGAGGRPCQGLYHRPAGATPKTALIANHYEVDFSEHYLADYMAARGYGFLGWNTRYRGNGAYFLLENALIDIDAGVRWLREQGVETIVILGNSGGASLMGAYLSQAVEPNIRPAVGMTLPDAVNDLEPADLFVSLNAHPGRPDVLTAWLDPSITDETDPIGADPTLDMFNADNGPPYDPPFVERYRAAQRARNDSISDWCHEELQRLQTHDAWDRVFHVYRAWADLRFTDLTIDPSDRAKGCYFGDPKFANYSPFNLASNNTLRTWLSMWSLRESQCTTTAHLGRVTAPALVVQSTADQGCFPSDARKIHDDLASADKRLDFMPGDHYLLSPSDARDQAADLITGWLEDHGARR